VPGDGGDGSAQDWAAWSGPTGGAGQALMTSMLVVMSIAPRTDRATGQ
jgi:hypothetical protein